MNVELEEIEEPNISKEEGIYEIKPRGRLIREKRTPKPFKDGVLQCYHEKKPLQQDISYGNIT